MAPAELESVLLSHNAVKDVAVIGIPDVRAGEVPKAFVVLKEGKQSSSKDLINYCSGKENSLIFIHFHFIPQLSYAVKISAILQYTFVLYQ